MSKFDKYFAKALDVQHYIMGDLAVITVKGKQLDQPISVVIDEDFGENESGSQGMFKIACIQKKDMSKFFNDLVITHEGKRYKADGLFVGSNYESDQHEWCIAIREIERKNGR